MPIRYIALALAGAAVVSAGCERSVRLLEPTPIDQTVITEVLTGTVAPPVNGVFQKTFKTYIVGQGGGAVAVTLTSAVQTRPDGSLQNTVSMGLGAGTVINGACVVPANAFVSTPAGPNPQLVGSLPAGTYCIQVSDVTGQVGPVAFSVTVTHT
ncbi:MAG: hypothetical protein ABIP90_03040 [Vicinamibacterales bacterium]